MLVYNAATLGHPNHLELKCTTLADNLEINKVKIPLHRYLTRLIYLRIFHLYRQETGVTHLFQFKHCTLNTGH